MKKNIAFCCGYAAFLLTAYNAMGATEELVVTGTFSKEPASNLTSAVTVLDRELIKNLNKRDLVGVLRSVPGLLIEEQGGAGGLVSVSLRGGESNFTVVMVDGVQLNDPTNSRGGSFDFGNLSLDSVERIEVVRGTQSSVYGSDALTGVINIITTLPRSGQQKRILMEAGDYGYWRTSATLAGQLETFDYKFQLGRRDSGEPVSGSEQRSDEFNMGLNWQPASEHKLGLNFRYADGERSSYPEQSGGPQLALSAALSHSDYADQSLVMYWSYQPSQHWQSTVTGSWYQRDETALSPGIVPYTSVPPNSADTEFERTNIRWVNRIGNQQYWLNAGLDRRDEQGRSDGVVDFGVLIPTAFQLHRITAGAFVDLNAQLTDSTLIQASARHDDPDSSASENSYKLGLRQDISANLVVMANWGQAFKLPSFFALGESLTGNPDLVPETAESWDLTVDWQGQEHRSSLTYFDNKFAELITFDEVNFKNINSQPVASHGVEWQWLWQPEALPVVVQAEVTYTDIDASDKSLRLTGRPERKGGIHTLWQATSSLNLTADYRYIGRQYAGSQHTGSGTTRELDSYHLLDLAATWTVSPQLTVNGALDNALDKKYANAVGFPGPGRLVRVGIELHF